LLAGYDDATKSHLNATRRGFVVMPMSADQYGRPDIALSGGIRLKLFLTDRPRRTGVSSKQLAVERVW
jgi:hypothetical protein